MSINNVIPKARPRTEVFEYEKNIAVTTKREGMPIDDMISAIPIESGIIFLSSIIDLIKFVFLFW